MKFTDEEIKTLYDVLIEEAVYPDPGKWDAEQTEAIDALFDRVAAEAKARDFWWAK